MSGVKPLRVWAQVSLVAALALLVAGAAAKSWPLFVIGFAALIPVVAGLKPAGGEKAAEPAGPSEAEFRLLAEAMARPIDPTPKRVLPPDEKSAMIAHVATTKEDLACLIAEKPPAWPWAVFTSVLVQRRNAAGARLRACASGYQPRPGQPQSGRVYSRTAHQAMTAIADLAGQTEQFMLSPAFKGAFGESGDEGTADADAIVAVANRLMDYHEAFLVQAESCLQTPVLPEAATFVQDMGALALCPLIGYEQFIPTMCARIGEAQDLLPYSRPHTVVGLDDVALKMSIPDGLADRVVAHTGRFNP